MIALSDLPPDFVHGPSELEALPPPQVKLSDGRYVQAGSDGLVYARGANGEEVWISAADFAEAQRMRQILRPFPWIARRLQREYEDAPATARRAHEREAAAKAEATAAEQHLAQVDQQRQAERAAARRKREGAIAREYKALRDEGHDQAYARHFSVYNVDSRARSAAQTAQHQARQAAALAAPSTSTTTAKPAPLRRLTFSHSKDI